MKTVVLLTLWFPIFSAAAEAPIVTRSAPDLSKYKATIVDPDVQLMRRHLRNLGHLSAREGGNVSGGGEDLKLLSNSDQQRDGADLQAFQLSLIGLPVRGETESRGKPASSATQSGKNRIAIVDSGLKSESRAARNVVHFADFTSRCGDTQMCDESLHGTLVTDLIYQAAPAAELVVLKVLDDADRGQFSATINALKWLNQNHAKFDIKIVNLSLVGLDQLSGFWDEVDEAKALVKKLTVSGVIVVSAAGNDFKNHVSSFPGNMPESITVGSYSHGFSNDTSTYVQSPFSNRGYAEEQEVTHFKIPPFFESTTRKPKTWHLKPEVTAPGEGLFACAGDRCYLVTGSSFAAGLVSGGLHRTIWRTSTRALFLEELRSHCPSPSFTGSFDGAKSCSARFDLGM